MATPTPQPYYPHLEINIQIPFSSFNPPSTAIENLYIHTPTIGTLLSHLHALNLHPHGYHLARDTLKLTTRTQQTIQFTSETEILQTIPKLRMQRQDGALWIDAVVDPRGPFAGAHPMREGWHGLTASGQGPQEGQAVALPLDRMNMLALRQTLAVAGRSASGSSSPEARRKRSKDLNCCFRIGKGSGGMRRRESEKEKLEGQRSSAQVGASPNSSPSGSAPLNGRGVEGDTEK